METNICRIEAKGGGGGLNTGVCRYVFTRVFMHAIKITSGQMAQVYTLMYARHDDIAGILLCRAGKLETNPWETDLLNCFFQLMNIRESTSKEILP